MSFRHYHKLTSYLIAGLGLSALCLGDALSPLAKSLLLLGYALSALSEGEFKKHRAFTPGINVALVIAALIQVGRGLLLGGAPLTLGLEFVGLLQISRLVSRKDAAEHQQIAALAFIHLIAATLISSSLAYGLIYCAFVVAAPWALTLAHLRKEIEAQYPSAEEERSLRGARAIAGVQRVLASRRLIRWPFFAGTALLSLPLFAMTAGVFLVFPRVGLGFLTFGQQTEGTLVGFGSNVELGEFGRLRDNPQVVLRVIPPDLPEQPPARAALRMRGTSFDHYDGHRWTRTEAPPRALSRVGDYYPVTRWVHMAEDREYEVILDPIDPPVIFLPPRAVGIEVPPRVQGGIERGRRIYRGGGMDLRYGDAYGVGLRYQAFASVGDEPPEAPLGPEERERYLQVPPGHGAVASLAEEWAQDAESDEEKIAAILRHLRRAPFRYSLELPPLEGQLPLLVFLFEARAGHCEYYSTAAALMLRSLGVPARNVTGFLGGRWNAFGGYYAIRQGDAHSWVEAWLPDRGWVTVEATPAARDRRPPEEDLASTLQQALDALRAEWRERIVGFDLGTQRSMIGELLSWYARTTQGEGPEDEAELPEGELPLRPAAAFALGLGLALALLWLAYRLRRRRAGETGRAVPPRAQEVVDLYRALEKELARRGLGRPPERTPREHALALEAEGHPAAPALLRITERYLEVRFGGASLEAEQLARLRADLASVRALPKEKASEAA